MYAASSPIPFAESTHEAVLGIFVGPWTTKGLGIALTYTHNGKFREPMLRFPGGGVEDGESVVQALLREANEEIGLDVKPSHVHFIHTAQRPNRQGGAIPHKQHVYIVEITSWDGFQRQAQDGEEILINKVYPSHAIWSAVLNNAPLDGMLILPHHRKYAKLAIQKIPEIFE